MWVRKMMRAWRTKTGVEVKKNYYYWYKSVRKGNRVVSECKGPASEKDYNEYLKTVNTINE